MRALLDVNVLIALFDADHVFHERAHAWWETNAAAGWASSAITENGMVRIMSNANYSERIQLAPPDLIDRLRTFAEGTDHEFWHDDLSLLDQTAFCADRLHGSRALTDIYLLALAFRHGGRLATFDERIPLSAARSATAENLCVI